MGAAMKRFWDWANQPVSLTKKKHQPVDSIPVLEESPMPEQRMVLGDNIVALDQNLEALASANDDLGVPGHMQPPTLTNPDDYLGDRADEAVNGVERYLQAHPITGASEQSWMRLMDEMRVIQVKRMRLTELEKECAKIKIELQECIKNLAMHARHTSTEESMTILMHEKRLELAKTVCKRIDTN